MASVEGRLTTAGKPVAKALIQFLPLAADGTPAVGMTDEDGRYELRQKDGTAGVLRGEYRVRVVAVLLSPPPGRTAEKAAGHSPDMDAGQVRVDNAQGKYDFELGRPPRGSNTRRE